MSSVGFDVFKSGMRVQNRGGAGGTVGWKYMLDRGADGHSVLLASPTPVIAALLEKKPPFDPEKVKIAAYYSVMRPTLMAPKGKPYSTWAGLVKYLKGGGKKLTIGGTITQALGQAVGRRERRLHRDLLVQQHAEQQRERVVDEQAIGVGVAGDREGDVCHELRW